jgi:Zn-dependent M28 family amino/carboxypeptidase
MQAANLALCAASVALLGLFVPGAPAASESCSVATNNTQKKLLACVTLDGVRRHEDEFQVIADSNGGTRATGTPGYEASVAYVAQTLVAAGFDVELDPFEFTFVPPASLSQTAPIAAQYQTGAFTGSGAGGVAGPVIPVDLALGTSSWPADPSTSTSGCEASDFAGLDFSGPQDIALIQRGACSFAEKAVNAEAAGAEAVVLFNQGDSPARMDLSVGNATTLPDGTPTNLSVLVVGASFPAGVALSELGSAASVDVDPPLVTTQYNVLAELPGHSDGSVVMVGAHLDSVLGSPGVQDNGSGSAAILEVARQMRKVKPHNTLRFAWWGAEESDLVGSTSYVDSLSAEEIEDIALYLNFDKIGSPNHVFFMTS